MPHLRPGGVIVLALQIDAAAFGVALAGEHLDELALAVAGNAGDADDLAAADRERHVAHRRLAAVVERIELLDVEARRAELAGARRLHGQFLGADHHARHGIGAQILDVPLPRELAAAKDGDLVGERHHLAEFVGDHQNGEIAGRDHAAQHAEHFVGFAGGQHRGRLVEDEKAALQIKLLEDLALLPLARGNRRNLGIERHAERHARQKFFQRLALACPIDHRGHMVARQHEIFRDRHGRHEREMLIDHAEAERVRGARIVDDLLPVIDQQLAVVGLVDSP